MYAVSKSTNSAKDQPGAQLGIFHLVDVNGFEICMGASGQAPPERGHVQWAGKRVCGDTLGRAVMENMMPAVLG